MNRAYRFSYFALALVALLVPGVRLLLGLRTHSQTIDPSAAQAGEVLFKREWKPADSLASEGDGLGPVFNARSCVACHNQGGPGGGGGLAANVTTFTLRVPGQPPREGVVHAFGVHRRETLHDVHSSLPVVSQPTLDQLVRLPGRENHCVSFPVGVHLSQRNTPALFGSKLIDEIPEHVIIAAARSQRLRWGLARADSETAPVGRPHRLPDGRIGRFGWKAQIATLSDFVQAACANELGLSNPGQPQPVPLYQRTATQPRGHDLTLAQCDQLTAYCASLPRPVERLPKDTSAEQAEAGKKLFHTIGCAECHIPKLGSVDGIYSDLLLHRMGAELVGGGSYGEPPLPKPDTTPGEGPAPGEWRTPPLWGVADSPPYLHDGRAATLDEAIRLHGGQGKRSADRFVALSQADQKRLIDFLKTLRAP